jgi:hypothetical protein
MSKLRKLMSLSPSERHLLIRALLLLLAVRLALWLLPFQRLVGFLRRPKRHVGGLPQTDASIANRIVWAVEVASRYVPRATCLVQALAAQVLLSDAGVPALLRIGVGKDAKGRFQAHAWVENGGKVMIGDRDLESYTPFRHLSGFDVQTEGTLSSTDCGR